MKTVWISLNGLYLSFVKLDQITSPGGTPTKEIPHVHLPNHYGWVPNEFTEYDLQKNKVLNVYKSLDRLGKGGYGTVFKVSSFHTSFSIQPHFILNKIII